LLRRLRVTYWASFCWDFELWEQPLKTNLILVIKHLKTIGFDIDDDKIGDLNKNFFASKNLY